MTRHAMAAGAEMPAGALADDCAASAEGLAPPPLGAKPVLLLLERLGMVLRALQMEIVGGAVPCRALVRSQIPDTAHARQMACCLRLFLQH